MKKVLIIDDEQSLLAAMRRMLKDTYKVVPASSVASAFASLQAEKFDAIVCNVMLPDNGKKCLREMKSRFPEMEARLLIATGFPAGDKRIPKGYPVIFKPFSKEELILAIEDIIERNKRA